MSIPAFSDRGSVSRQLSADIVAAEQRRHPGLSVTYRDLAVDAGRPSVGRASRRLPGRGAGNARARARRRRRPGGVGGVSGGGLIVVGAPMYNFSVPSQLKAWIDRLAVAGKTFRYTENGPVGLAGGKKVIVASSRGGFYGPGTPVACPRPSGELSARRFRLFRHYRRELHPRRRRGAWRGEQRAKAIETARGEIARLAA